MHAQGVVVFSSSCAECSRGAIKVCSSGERGAPPPKMDLDASLQDRGFVISDCEMTGIDIPVEYGGANPILGGIIADAMISIANRRAFAWAGARAPSCGKISARHVQLDRSAHALPARWRRSVYQCFLTVFALQQVRA